MFATAIFSQVPIATLGGKLQSVSTADTITFSDADSSGVANLLVSTFESNAFADSFNPNTPINYTGYGFAGGTFGALVFSGPSIQPSSVYTPFNYYETVAETNDDGDLVVGQFNAYPTTNELFISTDTPTSNAVFLGNLAETSTATDTIIVSAAFAGSTSESFTNTDAYSGLATFRTSVTETYLIQDTPTATANFVSSVAEIGTYTDTLSATVTYNVFINDALVLADTIYVTGWIKINDSQNPNWVVVNNTQ
jgi:hypothetical protein